MCLNFNGNNKPLKVIIDAGHGGKDSGAIVNGISEKDILFAISQKIKENESDNIEIILLRKDDQFMSLKERIEKINSIQPDLLVSLHIDNIKMSNKSITKAYLYKNDYLKKSYYYAKTLLEELNSNETEIDFANYYVLKVSNLPALNLTIGNMNNKEDFTFLNSEFGQNHISKQIIKGLQKTK
jgi:N-acetylmuramoyl-L-alanine amidase